MHLNFWVSFYGASGTSKMHHILKILPIPQLSSTLLRAELERTSRPQELRNELRESQHEIWRWWRLENQRSRESEKCCSAWWQGKWAWTPFFLFFLEKLPHIMKILMCRRCLYKHLNTQTQIARTLPPYIIYLFRASIPAATRRAAVDQLLHQRCCQSNCTAVTTWPQWLLGYDHEITNISETQGENMLYRWADGSNAWDDTTRVADERCEWAVQAQ